MFPLLYIFSAHTKEKLEKKLSISVSASRPLARVVYVGAKHPLHTWTDPLEICKLLVTDTLKTAR